MASWDCTMCVRAETGVDKNYNADLHRQRVDCKVGRGMVEVTGLERARWRRDGRREGNAAAVKPMPIHY